MKYSVHQSLLPVGMRLSITKGLALFYDNYLCRSIKDKDLRANSRRNLQESKHASDERSTVDSKAMATVREGGASGPTNERLSKYFK